MQPSVPHPNDEIYSSPHFLNKWKTNYVLLLSSIILPLSKISSVTFCQLKARSELRKQRLLLLFFFKDNSHRERERERVRGNQDDNVLALSVQFVFTYKHTFKRFYAYWLSFSLFI